MLEEVARTYSRAAVSEDEGEGTVGNVSFCIVPG